MMSPSTLKSLTTTNLLPSSMIWSSMSDSWSVKVDVTVYLSRIGSESDVYDCLIFLMFKA